MSSRQRSIWSLDIPPSTIHSPSFSISVRSSLPNTQENINLWSNDDLEDRQEDSKKRASSLWAFCRCCIIGSLLAGILLAIILALWLTSSSSSSRIASTTTTVSSTTTTSSTSTTSTTTTVSTTTTTTTVTTTTTTVSTTTTTATTTSTTTTTATTTTVTTTTTPTPPCAPVSVNSSSTLYTTSSGSITSYTCYAFAWTSPVTGSVNLAFQFRHDPDFWFLDDVSVYYGGSQMLTNGGFEAGSSSSWIKSTPNGACTGATGGQVTGAMSPHTGSYHYRDGCNGVADQISQQFTAVVGEVYIVSFWLKSGLSGSGISFQVTLS